MEYKGYSARVTFDDDAMIFHGEVDGIADVVTFQADTAEGLVQSFHNSVDDYLDFCAEKGRPPAKPFSGNFMVRAGSELHRAVSLAASRRNMNANQWVLAALRRQVSAEADEPMVIGRE